jgi:hypothetical protein
LSNFCRLKSSKITSFSNLEILVSLFGEISPEQRNPTRVQLLCHDGFILLSLSKQAKQGTNSDWLLLSPVPMMFGTSLPNIYFRKNNVRQLQI